MNQIKYSAYALLLVFTIASVAIIVDKFSSFAVPAPKEPSNKTETTTGIPIKNVEGKNLFQSNCQSCHALHKSMTGPALANVETRGPWTDRKNLIKWVTGSSAVVNDFEYTRKLYEEYNKQTMPGFRQLSESQIESIFDYIKEVQ